jgi:hypothetical protein
MITRLGPELDSHVPFGTCTILGQIAFNVTANILDLVYKTIPYSAGNGTFGIGISKRYPKDPPAAPVFFNLKLDEDITVGKIEWMTECIPFHHVIASKGAIY